jgi:hypothetical protein
MRELGRRNGWFAAVVALALLAWSPAAGQSVRDTGLVVAKDLAARTVTLDSGRVLHVPEAAVIRGADGQRETLEGLAVAASVGGGFVARGDAMVRYGAEGLRGQWVAHEIDVLGAVPR